MPKEPMICVYRLPDELTRGFCLSGGNLIGFHNVDWFNAEPPVGMGVPPPTEEELRKFIRSKVYYDPKGRYLVLDDRPGRTFVIEPEVA